MDVFLFKWELCNCLYALDNSTGALKWLKLSPHSGELVESSKRVSTWVDDVLRGYTSKGKIDPHVWDMLDMSGYTREEVNFYREVFKIPPGKVVTYGEIALKVWGSARMARKAGVYLKKNRFPLIIPCHRVWAKNGPGGFTPGGAELKQKLIDHERKKWR